MRHVRRAGFTLVELILVVALMMLIASAVAVNLDVIVPQARIESGARLLASDIAAARASSIAQGLSYWIEYDLRSNSYRIATPFKKEGGIVQTRPDSFDDPLLEEQRVTTEWKPMPAEVRIADIRAGTRIYTTGIHRIEMRPNGNTIEHTIHLLRDNPPGHIYLVVQGLTGFVQFYSGDWQPDVVDDKSFG